MNHDKMTAEEAAKAIDQINNGFIARWGAIFAPPRYPIIRRVIMPPRLLYVYTVYWIGCAREG